MVAKSLGFDILEMNASDTRNKKAIETVLAEAVGNTVISFGSAAVSRATKKRVVICDEVDGMSSGDRGGNAALIKVIKGSRSPIVCICNDRQKQSVRSLANSCFDMKFARPTRGTVAKRLCTIAQAEGLNVEHNAMEQLVESVGNDIRQVLNALQMWARSSSSMKYADLKDRMQTIEKDKLLRLTGARAFRVARRCTAPLTRLRALPQRMSPRTTCWRARGRSRTGTRCSSWTTT